MKPNLFLLAAPRSGSTQLAAWLDSHPDISLPSVKEPNYFSHNELPLKFAQESHLMDCEPHQTLSLRGNQRIQYSIFRTEKSYLRLFSKCSSKWIMDASTSYLASEAAIEKIHEFSPKSKIILLTRNPRNRAISHFHLAHRTGRSRLPLRAEVCRELAQMEASGFRFILRPSNYEYIHLCKNLFGSKSLLAIQFENLFSKPNQTLHEIAKFLEIPIQGFDFSVNRQNASMAPRFGWLNHRLQDCGVKQKIRRYLPRSIKAPLAAIWFKDLSGTSVDSEDRRCLSAHLCSE